MNEKYIRVEDFKNEIAELGDLRTLSTKTIGETLARCPTYTPAEIMAQQWVPVRERLPEPMVDVLAFYEEGYSAVDFVSFATGKFIVDGVTHWMPLPQPPKEGRHE